MKLVDAMKKVQMASLASHGALFGAVGVIAAIGVVAASTAESMDKKLTRAMDELAKRTDGELVDAFDKGGQSLKIFEFMAAQNVGTAIRLRDELKRQGRETTDLDRIIDRHIEAQRNVESSTKAATTAIDANSDALEAEKVAAREAAAALDGLLDSTLAQFNADLAYEQQVNKVEDALASYHEKTAEVMKTNGENTEAVEEMERATLDAAQAILGQAAAASEAAGKNAELAGKTLTAAEKAEIQRQELEKVRDTLAADSPLRVRLEEYLEQLGRIPAAITTTISQVFTSTGGGGAPIRRMHSGGGVSAGMPSLGGLRSDERPAILQVGETVLPKGFNLGDAAEALVLTGFAGSRESNHPVRVRIVAR